MSTTDTTIKLETLALNAADSARLLGISRGQFFKLHSMGRIPLPVRLGTRAPRWRRVELEAWLAAGCPDRETWERAQQVGKTKPAAAKSRICAAAGKGDTACHFTRNRNRIPSRPRRASHSAVRAAGAGGPGETWPLLPYRAAGANLVGGLRLSGSGERGAGCAMMRDVLLRLLDGSQWATCRRDGGKPGRIALPADPAQRARLVQSHIDGSPATLEFHARDVAAWTEHVGRVELSAYMPAADGRCGWLGIDLDAADGHGPSGLADPSAALRMGEPRIRARGKI